MVNYKQRAKREYDKRFYDLCLVIAKKHPEWDSVKVEAEAITVSIGFKKLEDV